jgi:hypothetical protein
MGTFLEFLCTALLTSFAGYLCLKHKPAKRKSRINKTRKKQDNTGINGVYRNYSTKFILVFFMGTIIFQGAFYFSEMAHNYEMIV